MNIGKITALESPTMRPGMQYIDCPSALHPTTWGKIHPLKRDAVQAAQLDSVQPIIEGMIEQIITEQYPDKAPSDLDIIVYDMVCQQHSEPSDALDGNVGLELHFWVSVEPKMTFGGLSHA